MKKRTRIQTLLYGEQQLERTEIDLLHTPALQRLYDLHQLGFTDRVYPDASHARLQHVLGVLAHVDKLMTALERNLGADSTREALRVGPWEHQQQLPKGELVAEVKRRRPAARLMGLLHDLTHAPFGHTLEDEIELSQSGHDDPDRQADMFYRLLCQYFAWLVLDNECPKCSRPLKRSTEPDAPPCEACTLDSTRRSRIAGVKRSSSPWPQDPDYDPARTPSLAEYMDAPELLAPPSDTEQVAKLVAEFLRGPLKAHRMAHYAGPIQLRGFLKNLNLAMESLLHLELLHKDQGKLQWKHVPQDNPYPFQRLIRSVLERVGDPLTAQDCFRPMRDAYLLDVIGNTVCADLMDYAKRDSLFAGLKQDFDADRIAETFTLVSADHKVRALNPHPERPQFDDPFAGKLVRTAISLRTHKLRTDVPGQVMGLLLARFHINERALFHPTKCIAGAMLGSALQLLNWRKFPIHLLHVGDAVFLHQLSEGARIARDLIVQLKSDTGSLFPTSIAELSEAIAKEVSRLPLTGAVCVANEIVSRAAPHAPFNELGDDLTKKAIDVDIWLTDLSAAIRIFDRLAARRYYRPVFRLLPKEVVAKATPREEADDTGCDGDRMEIIANVFADPHNRCEFERLIERRAELPRGAVVIHCPSYSGPKKIASILVFAAGADDGEPVPLREIGGLFKMFEGHQKAINAIENMYNSMWRLVVSVAPPFYLDYERLSECIEKSFVEFLVTEKRKFAELTITNDPTMIWELQEAEREAQTPERSDAPVDTRIEYDGLPTAFLELVAAGIASGKLPCPANHKGLPQAILDAIDRRPITKRELASLLKKFNPSIRITRELKAVQDEVVAVAKSLPQDERALLRRDLYERVPDEPLATAASNQPRMIGRRIREILQEHKPE